MYNIFKYKKYEKIKTENGWTVKSVLWKKNSDGEIAFKEELNSDKLLVRGTVYSDENFENLILTTNREYNEDKSYTQYDTYEQLQGDYQSIMGNFDNKKKLLFHKEYADKNFENLIREATKKYNKNGSYEEKVIDYGNQCCDNECCNIGCWRIDYCTKKGILYRCDEYDKDFKNLISTKYFKVLKNGNYRIRKSYIKNIHNCYPSSETIYKSKNDSRIIYSKHYNDNNFKNFDGKSYYTYHNDGSYTVKTIYNKYYDEYGCCRIEEFDKNDEIKEDKYYKDKNGKKLCKITTYENINKYIITQITENKKENTYTTNEYLENGNILYLHSYDTVQENNNLSLKWEYDTNNFKPVWEKYYSDKDFKDLIATRTFEYLDNNITVSKIIYEKIQNDRYYSQIIKLENDKEKQKYLYSDKNFKNLITEYIYNDDGSYVRKGSYIYKGENNIKSYILAYDKNNKVKEKNYYYDDNFKKLFCKEEYKYTKNPDKYSIKRIWTKPYENCIMSSIVTYYDKNNFTAIAYNDNNFKELYRKTWGKINKKDEKIVLKIYSKAEDGYFSIIEKLDKDNNKIYEKKYKFKGILARLLYFFAK